MTGYSALTLSGNGFRAQFIHLTAACFRKRGERNLKRGVVSGMTFIPEECLCRGTPHTILQNTSLWPEPCRDFLMAMWSRKSGWLGFVFTTLLSTLLWLPSTQNQITPQNAKYWQGETGHLPNRIVDSNDRKFKQKAQTCAFFLCWLLYSL
jgi:hypothetical protein